MLTSRLAIGNSTCLVLSAHIDVNCYQTLKPTIRLNVGLLGNPATNTTSPGHDFLPREAFPSTLRVANGIDGIRGRKYCRNFEDTSQCWALLTSYLESIQL